MPAKTSAPPALVEKSDLRACINIAGIAALLRKLRYPLDEVPAAVPLDPEDLPGRLRDGVAARYPLVRIDGAHPGDLLDIVLFVLRPDAPRAALVRGISQVWTRRFPGYHLLLFASAPADPQAGFDQLVFVHPRRVGEGAEVRVKLHKLIVERTAPTRHDLDTVNLIAVPAGGTTPAALNDLLTKAFDVERVTNAFYKEYAKRFKEAMERIKQDNRGIAAFHDLETGDAHLHTFTQRLFGRLMFLYFLQKKGALNADQNFIRTWYTRAASQNENFYQFVLEPLFFQTLNQQHDASTPSKFGRVPYLNGGLFAPDADDHKGSVYLANALFDANSESGLLYFLDNHNFTIEEDTPLEVQVALDPEMLGKVFENLLEAEERGKAGAFYTPRAVVAFMCREAMASYLERIDGLDPATLRLLLDEAETGVPVRDEQGQERLTSASLSWQVSERIEDALKNVRVLDPAVGSGAFPLGMLALLVGLRRALFRIGGAQVEPQSRVVEGWKRQFIRDCLYGVDIKHEAVEIARLRLWLSLVVDADPFHMLPLPNLDYKLMAGDSLIETFDGVAIYPTRPGGVEQQTLLGDEKTRELVEKLHRLKDAFFQPEGSEERTRLRDDIHANEVALVEEYLRERHKNENIKLDTIMAKLANIRGAVPADLAAERDHLLHGIAATDIAMADIRQGKHLPFFLYRLHFPVVFEQKGGFDIVIANPPYVSILNMDGGYKAQLKETYPQVAAGRGDLYTYFYARALQLLHDGGTLCFISSNKFYRAGYGKGLRETLASQTSTRLVIDFGDFPVFDAAAYPSILVASKGAPAPEHTYRGLTAGPTLELDKLDEALTREGQMLAQSSGVRPPAGNAASSTLVAKLLTMGTPLGKYVEGKMYYGIKTGLNEAFV